LALVVPACLLSHILMYASSFAISHASIRKKILVKRLRLFFLALVVPACSLSHILVYVTLLAAKHFSAR
ncbi:hypothetical protein, partial [Legionella geestiana]|uniref:hypothetical protein n=1 Tax=Legionella geestiana TaxID=45065 RepID=UPI001EE6BA0F